LLRTLCAVVVQLNDIHEAITALGPGVPSDPVAWDRYRVIREAKPGRHAHELVSNQAAQLRQLAACGGRSSLERQLQLRIWRDQ
jgi:hypothetical protein